MTEVILHGNSIKTISDFHKTIKKQLNFPDYYGENLDALWDCIRCINIPCKLVWLDYKTSQNNLGPYFQEICQIFNEAQVEQQNFRVEYR